MTKNLLATLILLTGLGVSLACSNPPVIEEMLKIGEKAPDFTLVNAVDGKSYQLSKDFPEATKGYIVTHLDEVEPVPCPCGMSRRAFVQPDNDVATLHVVDISTDAKTHYHKKLTEIYYILETEGEAFMELDTGGTRTPGDLLTVAGYDYTSGVASAIRNLTSIYEIEAGNLAGSSLGRRRVDPETLLEYAKEHGDQLVEAVKKTMSKEAKVVCKPPSLFAALCAWHGGLTLDGPSRCGPPLFNEPPSSAMFHLPS